MAAKGPKVLTARGGQSSGARRSALGLGAAVSQGGHS